MACQVRSILKTKKLSEVKIEALRRKLMTPQELVEVLIENEPIDGSDITPVIELNQNGDTQRIRIMMQENSNDPIPSL